MVLASEHVRIEGACDSYRRVDDEDMHVWTVLSPATTPADGNWEVLLTRSGVAQESSMGEALAESK